MISQRGEEGSEGGRDSIGMAATKAERMMLVAVAAGMESSLVRGNAGQDHKRGLQLRRVRYDRGGVAPK